ncbi:hypothetical protein BDN72DRAFT_899963 [Pluteus cervinus]|uniref:Uncharacterized protein n=1 Tax=Pluteus cervinus TaxID=181527 RepID=A0ACD3AM49_9AGAR|nr:hypothetical protein BDN72DRAFT_899963 [Pluteus cervinus]
MSVFWISLTEAQVRYLLHILTNMPPDKHNEELIIELTLTLSRFTGDASMSSPEVVHRSGSHFTSPGAYSQFMRGFERPSEWDNLTQTSCEDVPTIFGTNQQSPMGSFPRGCTPSTSCMASLSPIVSPSDELDTMLISPDRSRSTTLVPSHPNPEDSSTSTSWLSATAPSTPKKNEQFSTFNLSPLTPTQPSPHMDTSSPLTPLILSREPSASPTVVAVSRSASINLSVQRGKQTHLPSCSVSFGGGSGGGGGGGGGGAGGQAVNMAWTDNCTRNGTPNAVPPDPVPPLLDIGGLYTIDDEDQDLDQEPIPGDNPFQQEDSDGYRGASSRYTEGHDGDGEDQNYGRGEHEDDEDGEDNNNNNNDQTGLTGSRKDYPEEWDEPLTDLSDEGDEGDAVHEPHVQAGPNNANNLETLAELPGLLDEPEPDVSALDEPAPEHQILSATTGNYIISVANFAHQMVTEDPAILNPCVVVNLLSPLLTGENPVWKENQTLEGLDKLAHNCYLAENQQALVHFNYIMQAVIFRLSVHSEVTTRQVSRNEVLKDLIQNGDASLKKLGFVALKRYVADGANYCLLLGGGGICFLAMFACMTSAKELKSFTGDQATRIAALLRCPDTKTAHGRLVIQDIIPAIAYLRNLFPFILPSMFNTAIQRHFGCPELIDCRDLIQTDRLTDSLDYNSFVKGRDTIAWASCLNTPPASLLTSLESGNSSMPSTWLPVQIQTLPPPTLPVSIPPPPVLPSTSRPDVFVIPTAFDPDKIANRKVRFPRGDKPNTQEERFQWTERERQIVLDHAVNATSLEDLLTKTQRQLQSGTKEYIGESGHASQAYIKVTNPIIREGDIQFTDKNGDPLLIVCSGMPNHIRWRLFDLLLALFREAFKPVNTYDERKLVFAALHFSFYNRYSVHGRDYDPKQDPSTIQNNKKKVNTAQFIPRASRDLLNHPAKYGLLQQMLAPVFTWIDKTVEKYLPEEHEDLRKFTESLPGNTVSPASPFSGFVINLNVTTQVHRDWNDQSICVVTIISKCEGGELVLVEPGLVLDLQVGDTVIFPSSRLSHFNMHFKGYRASLVCHSDKHATAWTEFRNHFWYHALFRSSQREKRTT